MHKILIANRGEIALRVLRACRELAISVAAVFTEPDRFARHAAEADESYLVSSYLAADEIVAIAREAGADAVHPGYGFLAENADFARSCQAAGLVWIGPCPDAIEQMGSKTQARRVAEAAGVPIVPGTTEPLLDPLVAVAFGDRVGWPIAIKAAAGGGGRGFAVAEGPGLVEEAMERARREGERYFASGEIYLEKYLPRPRHIEVQLLADKHGAAIHLGERECSIQRRHQKLIEECPSVAIDAATRHAMGEAAVQLARAVGYDSAGTVEFLFSEGKFFFLEMNTRIQVEHTITEAVYGVDLVKEQIQIAAGARLRPELAERAIRGWAIECRINAEDPAADFRPDPGQVALYRRPAGPGVRVDDAAPDTSWKIPEQYDSLIAKVVAWGEDRHEAIARMVRALREMRVDGVATTIPFHLKALAHPDFVAGNLSTHFVGTALSTAELKQLAAPQREPVETPVPLEFRTFEVEVGPRRFSVRVADAAAKARRSGARPAGKRPASSSASSQGSDGTLTAPMHATVQRVLVEAGQAVESGQIVVVLEAMKMETEIACPHAGVVSELAVAAGQTVEGGSLLAVIKA